VAEPTGDDEEQVRAVVAAYAERLDAGDFDGVAALFEHGEFRSAQGGPARIGPEGVRRMLEPVVRYDDGTPRTKHVLGNIEVDVDADAGTATARCTFTVIQHAPDAPLQAVLAGRYHDRLERLDGRWHLVERVVHPDLFGDLRHHMRAR
jgi:3-phenylpropionate/cinnamic acid dioxygenase small subunit